MPAQLSIWLWPFSKSRVQCDTSCYLTLDGWVMRWWSHFTLGVLPCGLFFVPLFVTFPPILFLFSLAPAALAFAGGCKREEKRKDIFKKNPSKHGIQPGISIHIQNMSKIWYFPRESEIKELRFWSSALQSKNAVYAFQIIYKLLSFTLEDFRRN